jgi:ppGpp synthetase/RelA/SpoT-type nucleotidyltranferase
MENKLVDWYITNEPIYKRLSKKIESLLSEVFEINNSSYHLISSRTKAIDSVRDKGKSDKYKDPIREIQDFSGIRVITYVEDEISIICKLIEDNFDIDFTNSSNKSDALGVDRVGYKSVHYVASLKSERLKLPEYKQFEGKVFELQIRTILQHAWAEIEHDRNYKFSGKLPDNISRRFKIVAGVLEMADREFNNISQEIDVISESTKEATNSGNLNIPITSVSMSQFLQNSFSEQLSSDYDFRADHEAKGINELELCGITKLDKFSQIFTQDVKDLYFLMVQEKYIAEVGAIRISLILADYNKYFEKAYPDTFKTFGYIEDFEQTKLIFERNNVDWEDINSRFGVSLNYDDL